MGINNIAKSKLQLLLRICNKKSLSSLQVTTLSVVCRRRKVISYAELRRELISLQLSLSGSTEL